MVLFIIVYGIMLSILVLGGGAIHGKKAMKPSGSFIDLQALTVIIPFRNEAMHLPQLIACFQQAQATPKEVIFVNDHSEDDGMALLSAQQFPFPCRMVELPEDQSGKKAALQMGLLHAQTTWILTMDADVSFTPDYFNALERLPAADFWILPVVLVSKKAKDTWQEVDVLCMHAVNTGLFGFIRPVLCSGANLLMNREVYVQVHDWEQHKHISSGDDLFSLRAFRKAGRDIRLLADARVAVFTPSTEGIRSFFQQRLRWISKTRKVQDPLANLLGIIQGLLATVFLGGLLILLCQQEYHQFWILLGLKSLVDWAVFAPYCFRFNRWGAGLLIPLIQWFSPLYFFSLLVCMPFITPQWKGRKVNA